MRRAALASILGFACLAACGGEARTTPEVAAGSATGTTGGGGGGGAGGSGGGCGSYDDCDLNEACVYADGQCGAGEGTSCIDFPATGPAHAVATFCGCDGHSHAGVCFAEQDTRPGACPAEPGTFWCGEVSCSIGQEYCLATNVASCDLLPPGCEDPSADCACFEPIQPGCTCAQKADGHFELACSPI